MATILKKILDDKLITEPLVGRDPSVLPSPEDLKFKVLIRVRFSFRNFSILIEIFLE